MDLGIKGRVAIVTGGSRGLGRQAALSLAGEGVNVVICARGDEKLKETVEEVRARGSEADGVVADCSLADRHWGRIISIASIFGREHGGPLAYMTSKAALIAATKHHALELAKDNVLCNTVAPGSILFPGGSWEQFTDSQPKAVVDAFIATNLPMGRFGWPEPVGDIVAFLASERADLITGTCINVDGGQSKSLI
jgi:NAD(P)-dependent dehydrogenase (short-subunit alcohol dehydrogenase family)